MHLSCLEWVVPLSHHLKISFLFIIYKTYENYTNTNKHWVGHKKIHTNIQTTINEFNDTRWNNLIRISCPRACRSDFKPAIKISGLKSCGLPIPILFDQSIGIIPKAVLQACISLFLQIGPYWKKVKPQTVVSEAVCASVIIIV